MNDDLSAYLEAIDTRLRKYLDDDKDLSLGTVEHLYRYSVALLQGLVKPAHIAQDFFDFFCLADAFVLAYGSRRLGMLNRRSFLQESTQKQEPLPLSCADSSFLVALVHELGQFVSSRQHAKGGGTH